MKLTGKILLVLFGLFLVFGLPSLHRSNAQAQSISVPYYYVATAVDSSGNESVFSNQAGPFTPTAAKPHIVLTWTASTSSVVGYNIYRGTASGGPYTKVNSSIVTTLTYTDLFLFPAAPTALAGANN